MDPSNDFIQSLSQNFLMVNKTLLLKLGPCPALFMCLLIDKFQYWKKKGLLEDGWFFKRAEEIEKELGLSDHDRRICCKKLESMGLIFTKKIGVPCKLHYKINWAELKNILEKEESLEQEEGAEDNDEEKSNNIRRDLNLRPLEVQNLDVKRSKISTSITNTPDTKIPQPTTQGSLRGGFSEDQEGESSSPTPDKSKNTPTIDQIRRAWEKSFLNINLPAQQDRLPLLRDLMTTLKSFGYTEDSLPRNMAETVTAHWWSKAKDKKVKEALKERSLKDYDLALSDLSDPVEIKAAPKMQNKASNKPKVTHESGSMSLDAFFDLVDNQGILEETDEFYEHMCRLAGDSE